MDFCLESSQMSYMPLKGLRLLHPFRFVVTCHCSPWWFSEHIQRALYILLFYFSFPFPTLSHIFLGPSLFSSCLSSPCIPELCQPCWWCWEQQQPRCAHHLGQAAPAASWSLQILTGGWSTATIPASCCSPRELPLCWPHSFTCTRSAQLRKASEVPHHRAQSLQLDSPIPMDLLLHPLPLLHVEPERKQEKYENMKAFNVSAHHFEPFSFCYWNVFQDADFRDISAQFFQARFIYSPSLLAVLSLKQSLPHTVTTWRAVGVSCWLHGGSFTSLPTQGILWFCDWASSDFSLARIGRIVI